jgi:hypothetical protein
MRHLSPLTVIHKSTDDVADSEYLHVAEGAEITLRSEILKVSAEGCLTYDNRNLLYIEGITTVGSACCGMIECRVIYVPGFIISWHYKKDDASGRPLSKVVPITEPSTLADVKKLLCKTFPSSLFLFY